MLTEHSRQISWRQAQNCFSSNQCRENRSVRGLHKGDATDGWECELTAFFGCAIREKVKSFACLFGPGIDCLAGAFGDLKSTSSSCVSQDIMFGRFAG